MSATSVIEQTDKGHLIPLFGPRAHVAYVGNGRYTAYLGYVPDARGRSSEAFFSVVGDGAGFELLDSYLQRMLGLAEPDLPVPHSKLVKAEGGRLYLYEPWGLRITANEADSHPQNGVMWEAAFDTAPEAIVLYLGRLKAFRGALTRIQDVRGRS